MAQSFRKDPLWYKDSVIYQLHIKSFYDSNADGFGDINGLIEKLDYIQDLGVDAIWMLPFYPSPMRDDGYDIADYESINPVYGSESDFRRLLREAHRRGLNVITELVINHTSDQHPWFQVARYAPPGTPERDFYVWSDDEEKYKDARIIFTDTERSNWTWDPVAKSYYWHRFFSHQPDLNFDNPLVFEAIIDVMRKWLDMGVDGLRLDAIPYLIEREGTICENLPETHAILKGMRKVIDDHYPDRVFLAEANQWPADVREYFGNGDECHMAFHFPVMPRLYMALHLEDRHPITDIMRQTPEIPDNCQWAMFLRNHDELTLEMVTDDERDYMYRAYATHPMMRINVGIRRRLAPLMEYSRPRIQLMNGLLFSLPGTPIVYYGDEIGMGDNVYLYDRNGVRTPMQWSSDRNAGFSRAPFAQLYLPPLMDPITGYQAVNVEAQQLDPSSLLNWMKTIIKLRKRYKVFGRGSIELIAPSNRKVLAFVRKYEDETVLVVANLSRHPQSCEIDLKEYAGISPVEMFGLTNFHPISQAPYVVTLGPYQFYWLLLSYKPESLPVSLPPSEQPAAVETAVNARSAIRIVDAKADNVWQDMLSGGLRKRIEGDVLPWYISRQRWFGRKSARISHTTIVDFMPVKIPAEEAGIFLVEVETTDGVKDLYALHLALASGYRAKQLIEYTPEFVLADLRRKSESLALYDAIQSDRYCRELLGSINKDAKIPTKSGTVSFEKTTAYDTIAGAQVGLGIKRINTEQSNSSIIFGDQFILKLYRRLQLGINPDYEIGRFLTERTPFEHAPPVAGAMTYAESGAESASDVFMLGLLQGFIGNQGDGWSYTIEELRRFYERAESHNYMLESLYEKRAPLYQLVNEEIPEEAESMLGIYLSEAANLGRRTGEFHVALASDNKDPIFKPERMTPDEISHLIAEIHRNIEQTFSLLQSRKRRISAELQPKVEELLGYKQQLLNIVDGLKDAQCPLIKTRVHGDYHLGQVLNAFGDWVILDFEGEPGRSLKTRMEKQPPLKDVAGMLRSFSYAAFASLFIFAHNRTDELDKFIPWAEICETWCSVAFMQGYLASTQGQTFLPTSDADCFDMLLPFIIDKAVYEINYEVNNRPDWLGIPVTSLLEDLRHRLNAGAKQ
jgi:maltose alpha-D-glucosyltransferase / alpha-amylase